MLSNQQTTGSLFSLLCVCFMVCLSGSLCSCLFVCLVFALVCLLLPPSFCLQVWTCLYACSFFFFCVFLCSFLNFILSFYSFLLSFLCLFISCFPSFFLFTNRLKEKKRFFCIMLKWSVCTFICAFDVHGCMPVCVCVCVCMCVSAHHIDVPFEYKTMNCHIDRLLVQVCMGVCLCVCVCVCACMHHIDVPLEYKTMSCQILYLRGFIYVLLFFPSTEQQSQESEVC